MQTKRLGTYRRRKYQRILRHGMIRPQHIWRVGNRAYDMGSERCKWCKGTEFWYNMSPEPYVQLCRRCYKFLSELENPVELRLIREQDYGDIPF